MNEQDKEHIEQLIKKLLPSIDTGAGVAPRRDLWPSMLKRLETRPTAVPWFDWALMAMLAAWFALYPGAIPVLVYHL